MVFALKGFLAMPILTDMATFEYRSGNATRWLVPVLALYLVLSGGAVVWMLIENASQIETIRTEAEKELLVSELTSAVQIEAEHAGVFAGLISGMDDGDSMGSMTTSSDESEAANSQADGGLGESGMFQMLVPEPESGGLLADNPELVAAIASFGEATGSLKLLMSASEAQALNDVATAHLDYMASLAALDTRSLNGQESMTFYHGDTQMIEGVLRTGLQRLDMESNTRLQSAIGVAGSAETQLKAVLPLLLITGLLAAGYLVRTQSSKRQIVALEHLVEAKGDFIAAVSHELRTPLTAVVGFAELLRNPDADLSTSDRAELIASIAEQSDEVTSIVEDLLVAARTEIGELAVVAVPIDLRAQTAQVLETLDQSGSIAVVGTPPKAVGDPVRVRQILRNLITNAKRYGGDQISIELEMHSGTHASITVRDSGDPIPAEDRERIFQPYERAHNQPGIAGSIGLGLAVSHRLARLMGGDLTYRHQDDHTMFQLSLPLTDPADRESERLAVATGR